MQVESKMPCETPCETPCVAQTTGRTSKSWRSEDDTALVNAYMKVSRVMPSSTPGFWYWVSVLVSEETGISRNSDSCRNRMYRIPDFETRLQAVRLGGADGTDDVSVVGKRKVVIASPINGVEQMPGSPEFGKTGLVLVESVEQMPGSEFGKIGLVLVDGIHQIPTSTKKTTAKEAKGATAKMTKKAKKVLAENGAEHIPDLTEQLIQQSRSAATRVEKSDRKIINKDARKARVATMAAMKAHEYFAKFFGQAKRNSLFPNGDVALESLNHLPCDMWA